MNIIGTGKKMDGIRFKHKGMEENFQCMTPGRFEEEKLKPSNIGIIEFEDTEEIEALINILEYFKEGCEIKIGKWRSYEE